MNYVGYILFPLSIALCYYLSKKEEQLRLCNDDYHHVRLENQLDPYKELHIIPIVDTAFHERMKVVFKKIDPIDPYNDSIQTILMHIGDSLGISTSKHQSNHIIASNINHTLIQQHGCKHKNPYTPEIVITELEKISDDSIKFLPAVYKDLRSKEYMTFLKNNENIDIEDILVNLKESDIIIGQYTNPVTGERRNYNYEHFKKYQ